MSKIFVQAMYMHICVVQVCVGLIAVRLCTDTLALPNAIVCVGLCTCCYWGVRTA